MKLLYVLFVALLIVFTATPPRAVARNVDLSTVPNRNSVRLTIYNSEDLTLVSEQRSVTFKKGANPLQFSWANTLIDPSSVELKFLTHADQLDVLDTTFPHDKPQMLYWNVKSDFDGEATIQISYFTSGITWSADYLCVADKDETQMNFEGFVRVSNHSGEEYEGAEISLVVGTVNLVEKIAQLAGIQKQDVETLAKDVRAELRTRAAREMLDESKSEAGQSKEKEIIKEGLSEYFIYTIEGTETIPNGWSKRMRSFEGQTIPFKIQYRYRPQEYGEQLVRMYLLTNDKESKLGTTPLPDGIVRVLRDNGRDGLSYLTQQAIKYIPIGDKIELNLGPDPEVIFELIKRRYFRDQIWLKHNGADVLQRVEDGAVKIEPNSSVVGWNAHEIFSQRIRNYTAKPIDVEIRRTFPGHVDFRSQLKAKLHDFRTVEFSTTVEPGKRVDLLFELVHHQGHNSKQNNVTLQEAEVK